MEENWSRSSVFNIYKEQVISLNFSIRSARRAHFSKMIAESKDTINRLLNPVPINDVLNQISYTRCEEFLNKSTTIRAAIVIDADNNIN